MKRIFKICLGGLAFLFANSLILSCTSEEPFDSYNRTGEGTVSFQTELKSDVMFATRAIDSTSLENLEKNLVVYIENNKGVIRKYNGKSNLPKSLTLAVGNYIIEGWTGDSVSASHTAKFYRGKQEFKIAEGANDSVKFKVNIANVIVSIDSTTLGSEFKDIKVKINNSRGALDFDRSKIFAGTKGYFMMPSTDTDLDYVVTVTSQDGKPITKEGKIPNVQRAHEYKLQISADQPDNTYGGALVKVQIQEINVLDQNFEIFPGPAFKAFYGVDEIDIENEQINCVENKNDFKLRVLAYGGLSNLTLDFDSQFGNDYSTVNNVNLRNSSAAVNALAGKGITFEARPDSVIPNYGGSSSTINVYEVWFTFPKTFFESLDPKDDEYVITIKATDGRSNSRTSTIRIAASEKAIENNLISSDVAPDANDKTSPMAILANSVTLSGKVYAEDASDFGIEYRVNGSQDAYKKVKAEALTRAGEVSFSVTIKGLEPGTTYEYKAYCDDYEEKNSRTFTTEDIYYIPNSNMNDWSNCSDVTKNTLIPNANGNRSFWDTGNHGSMSLGALGGKNITTNNDSFIPGNTVACLQSQFVGVASVGRLAAGNLFVGEFIKTVGTSGAELKFGREFNNSHPSALKVKVNYRPGVVDYSSIDQLKKNDTDQGQIYIALASSQSELNTANGVYFDENADNILAYGQITWENNIGENNQLETVSIPFKYKSKAKTTQAKYIIIVCSASKYGDYFTGSSTSVMYLDDFELEYGDVTFE